MEISTQEEYDRQQQRLKKEEMEQLKLKVLQERSEYVTAHMPRSTSLEFHWSIECSCCGCKHLNGTPRDSVERVATCCSF